MSPLAPIPGGNSGVESIGEGVGACKALVSPGERAPGRRQRAAVLRSKPIEELDQQDIQAEIARCLAVCAKVEGKYGRSVKWRTRWALHRIRAWFERARPWWVWP